MDRIQTLKEQIQKAGVILAESRENLENNPTDYSARLLVMSTENYLEDLLGQLHVEESQEADTKSLSPGSEKPFG